MEVKVANGEKLVSQGMGQFLVEIKGVKCLIPFHVLPMGGYDAILGVQWLKTLGPINWDFAHMSMQFYFRKKQVELLRVHAQKVEVQLELKSLKFFFARQQGLLI